MKDLHDAVAAKVLAVFHELAPDRAGRIAASQDAVVLRETLAEALAGEHEPQTARNIAFHLADGSWEAAFLVAVHLWPERFTPEEIRAGVNFLLTHAPNHLAAAAKLAGWPVADVWDLGALDGPDD